METTKDGLRKRLDKLYDMLIMDYGINPENNNNEDIFNLLDEIDILVNAQIGAINILCRNKNNTT